MRIVITLFGVMLILMMFGGMLAAIHAFRGQDFTEPHIVVDRQWTNERDDYPGRRGDGWR